ncbi:hypothetical protein SUGI_1112400 [Cryptomeria japonica]|nr:hypothetical protein SUGI_1112400 [Cryptomeria japonica]
MVHRFGLSCLCCEESLEAQCERLFDIDTEGQNAIHGLLEDVFSKERHWCDGYIYEPIPYLLVDVLSSKEACMQKMVGFVSEEDAEAVGGTVLEVEEEWANILSPYFNPAAILSDVECPDSEDEAQLAAVALRNRKEEFMVEAWEVFRVGVMNADMGPFRRMIQNEDGWLSEGHSSALVHDHRLKTPSASCSRRLEHTVPRGACLSTVRAEKWFIFSAFLGLRRCEAPQQGFSDGRPSCFGTRSLKLRALLLLCWGLCRVISLSVHEHHVMCQTVCSCSISRDL